MGEDVHLLVDSLDALFDAVSKHDWHVPQWMKAELRRVKQRLDIVDPPERA